MSSRDLARTLGRSWYLMALLTLLGIAAGAGSSLLTGPSYRATASLYVAATSADTPSDLIQGATYVQIAVKNYAQLATTPYVLSPVIKDLDLRLTPEQLAGRLQVTVPTDTTLVSLDVEARTAQQAITVTNAVARSLQQVATSLTPGQTSDVPPVRITLVEAADTTATRASAGLVLAAATGAIGGLLLAIAVSLLREALRTRLLRVEEVERLTGSPVLAAVRSRPRGTPDALPVSAHGPEPLEDYRALAAQVGFLRSDDGLRVFSIVSPRTGTDTGTVALRTAQALAAAGNRVLLIDASTGRGGVSDAIGRATAPGLQEALDGLGPLSSLLHEVEPHGLAVLPRGNRGGGLMNEEALGTVLEEFAAVADLVLVDAASVLDDADCAVVVRRTSTTLLVARLRELRAADLSGALTHLSQLRATVSGVIAVGASGGRHPASSDLARRVTRRP